MAKEQKIADGVGLYHGDCREVLKQLSENSIDACLTDPPYSLVSISKRFGKDGSAPAKSNGATGVYRRASAGFMGCKWDTGEVAFDPEFWQQVLRVLKPGAHLLAMGGTRTYHRLACAIEDAGFEIRDAILWHYGVGFPKSHNVSKNDAFCQCEAKSPPKRNLRPLRDSDVSEEIDTGKECGEVLLSGLQEQGSSSAVLWSQPPEGRPWPAQSSMEGRRDLSKAARQLCEREIRPLSIRTDFDGPQGRLRDGTPSGDGAVGKARSDADRVRASSEPQAAGKRAHEFGTVAGQSQPQERGAWDYCGRCGKPVVPEGLGTALKPATEIICLARKPLSEGTIAANVLKWGTGALNIDGCRVGNSKSVPASVSRTAGRSLSGSVDGSLRRETGLEDGHNPNIGRWPANVIHDGSEEVVAAFPDSKGQQGDVRGTEPSHTGDENTVCYGEYERVPFAKRNDSGSAARFFYTAKADRNDRLSSKHPTVKPVDLMAYLCRLITPPGGTVLDPFAGTGTTGEACLREGFKSVLVERESEYVEDIKRRMRMVFASPTRRRLTKLRRRNLREGAFF